jgi:hypothetical protein
MPGVIESFVLLALTSAGLSGAALAIGTYAIAGAITIGISIGVSYLSSLLFAPKQPKPEDVQTSVRNPTSPRQRHYGRVKTSGPWVFGEAKDGGFHKVIAIGTGEIDAIEEYWVDDIQVTPDGSGDVADDPFDGKLRILTRLGLATETHYSELTSEFPEWDSSHVGHGVASLYAKQRPVKAKKVGDVFPSFTQTLYRLVIRGAKIFNPSTELTAWSDNAAAIIRDYMTHADGMRLPMSLFTTTQATEGWLAAYNRAALPVDKKTGGTEDAYRLWGTYTFDERPADVLGRMLKCSDSRIIPTPDGGIALDIGTWAEPTVTIDEDAIVGFDGLSRGRDALTTANIISATFLSPENDYQATDADQWIDEDDVSARGAIVSDMAFNMAPSHGQARRLMKLAAYRANPSWTGTIQCNLRALAAFNHRFVRVTYPLFEIDEVFEVLDFRFNIGEGGILIGVTLQVQSMPEEAYQWDALTEEGTAPISESTESGGYSETAGSLDVDIVRETISGITIPYADLSWPIVTNDALKAVPQYKKSADSTWIDIPLPDDDAAEARTPALIDNTSYDFRYELRKSGGTVVDTSDVVTELVVADETAPTAPSSVAAVLSGADGDIDWVNGGSVNHYVTKILRGTRKWPLLASTVQSLNAAQVTYLDTSLPDGTSWYWVSSANSSGVESTRVYAGEVTKNAATNLLAKSHDFSTWGTSAGHVAGAADGWLSGTLGASKIIQRSAAFTQHFKNTTISITNGQTYVHLLLVKAAEISTVILYANDGSVSRGRSFNLAAGTSAAYTSAPTAYGMTSLSDGWWLVWIEITAVATSASAGVVIRLPDATGDGASGIYVDHAQSEASITVPSGLYYRKN